MGDDNNLAKTNDVLEGKNTYGDCLVVSKPEKFKHAFLLWYMEYNKYNL